MENTIKVYLSQPMKAKVKLQLLTYLKFAIRMNINPSDFNNRA